MDEGNPPEEKAGERVWSVVARRGLGEVVTTACGDMPEAGVGSVEGSTSVRRGLLVSAYEKVRGSLHSTAEESVTALISTVVAGASGSE